MAGSVLVITGAGTAESARAERLVALLRDRGRAVALVPAGDAAAAARAVRRGTGAVAVITSGPARAHLAGLALRRRGVTWLLDLAHGWPPAPEGTAAEAWLHARMEIRLTRAADAVLCADAEVLDDLHRRVGAASLVVADDAGPLEMQLDAQARLRRPAGGLRVLMLGPVNSPHVEHLSLAIHERGVDVLTAGDVWPGLPPSVLPAAGLPLDTVTPPLVLWLRRILREFRPDVVHAHWTPFAFKALLAGARPLVVTPWGSDVYRAEGVFALANAPLARAADLVVTDSDDLISRMVDLGTPRERTELLNWGVDLARFTPPAEPREAIRVRLGLAPGPVILSPRSLTPIYNPATILEAFGRVGERFPDAQLVLKHMAADSPDLGPLPHADRVHVVAHVPYELMADYYRAADVCISIADTDSSPRSVWEAMACGCPCVISDLPWVDESLRRGEHALVVPVDVDAVTAAVEGLLTDAAQAQRIAAAARELVERTRDQRREMDRLVSVYERVGRR